MTLRTLGMALAATALTAPAMADEIDLGDYLASMDRAEVSFSGNVRYDRSESRFIFYNEDRQAFGATMDAGRDARERIETNCESSGYLVYIEKLCTISGGGTVEIRGSQVFISIERVDHLSPPLE